MKQNNIALGGNQSALNSNNLSTRRGDSQLMNTTN